MLTSARDRAKSLLQTMPIGNARIYCKNMITPKGYLNSYWESVIFYLDIENSLTKQ